MLHTDQPPAGGWPARFTELVELGRGRMGVVYRALDTETGLEVALKTLAGRTAEDLYRLKREFRLLADALHPNLVELYELFVDDTRAFFTMELVDGGDLAEYTGVGATCDFARLEAASRQLAAGVAALHGGGFLHRDIKPSNVRVDRSGRVLLLDFGLAAALSRGSMQGESASAAEGSLAYLAPEILFGGEASSSADWYAVGALLFELLAGQTPFAEARNLAKRMTARPPAIRSLVPSVPEPWEAALASLLDPQPENRQSGAAFFSRRIDQRPLVVRTESRSAFVGRRDELACLSAAWREAAATGPQVVRLTGPSGIGKSTLVRRWIDSRRGDENPPLVLAGKCHPQESVPYKAFDQVIDGLSRSLREADELSLDIGASELVRLFPVLATVPWLHAGESGEVDPQEVRRRGFAGLKQLLAAVAAKQPLLLWIDDLQWSDRDSALLLRELLRPPALPLFVLLTYRSEDEHSVDDLGLGLEELRGQRLALSPLTSAECTELIQLAGHQQPVDERQWQALIAESAGNPFLVWELAQSGSGPVHDGLPGLVRQRVGSVGQAGQRLMDLISVSGAPLPRSVLLDAAAVGEQGRAILRHLEKQSLVRTTLLSKEPAVETYHDRIREVLADTLAPESRRGYHAVLAAALERQPEPNADALFRNYLGAGERSKAGTWAVRAAERSAAALAFDQAARMYGEALALQPPDVEAWTLLRGRADALANAGQSLAAAQLYQSASESVAATQGSGGPESFTLRRLAATHFLQTGHIDEGVQLTRDVLAEVGVPYPRSQGHALLAAARRRWQLWRRGMDFTLRPDGMSDADRRRFDACFHAGVSLSMLDQASSEYLGVSALCLALDSGDPLSLVRSLSAEVSRTAQLGGRGIRERCARLLGQVGEIVSQFGGPYERAQFHTSTAMLAFQTARWRPASENFDEAERILRKHCYGVKWEMVTVQTFALSALMHMGEIRAAAARLPDVIGDAEERGDIYANLMFHTGVLSSVWLANDQADEALRLAEDAMAQWPVADRFQVEHYVHLIATVNADIYRGDGWSAFRRMVDAWPKLRAALFLLIEGSRVELRNLRARATLAALAASESGGTLERRWPRRRLLRLAEGDAAALSAETGVVSGPMFGALIRAGIASAQGRADDATRLYAGAARAADSLEMYHYGAAARWRSGDVAGASEWARQQAIVRPESLLAMCAPGRGSPSLVAD